MPTVGIHIMNRKFSMFGVCACFIIFVKNTTNGFLNVSRYVKLFANIENLS